MSLFYILILFDSINAAAILKISPGIKGITHIDSASTNELSVIKINHNVPIKYQTIVPMIIASILKDVVLFLFIIKLVIDTIIGKLKMYPPV